MSTMQEIIGRMRTRGMGYEGAISDLTKLLDLAEESQARITELGDRIDELVIERDRYYAELRGHRVRDFIAEQLKSLTDTDLNNKKE